MTAFDADPQRAVAGHRADDGPRPACATHHEACALRLRAAHCLREDAGAPVMI